MKTSTSIIVLVVLAVVCLGVGAGTANYIRDHANKSVSSIGENPNVMFNTNISQSVPVLSTSTTVLVSSVARLWALLSNNSSNQLYCNYFNGSPASSTNGFIVAASTTVRIVGDALYTGTINCVAPAGTSTVYVEAVQ